MTELITHRQASALQLDAIEAPLALCSTSGVVEAATPMATELMAHLAVLRGVPGSLPRDLWQALERLAPGESLEWRSPSRPMEVLGCTRYSAGGRFVLLLRNVSGERVALSRRLHRQEVEVTSRLVASIAHELRSSLSSIVYSADFLDVSAADLTPRALRSTLQDIGLASRQLQLAVNGMLDHAGLGPGVSVPVSLRDVVVRSSGLLKTNRPDTTYELELDIAPEARWVRGNPLSIEQIFINLLANAVEALAGPRRIVVTSSRARRPGADERAADDVRVRIWDDGPGIPPELAECVFDQFFTTKTDGAGVGLTGARKMAESLDGALILENTGKGACFALFLPMSEVAA